MRENLDEMAEKGSFRMAKSGFSGILVVLALVGVWACGAELPAAPSVDAPTATSSTSRMASDMAIVVRRNPRRITSHATPGRAGVRKQSSPGANVMPPVRDLRAVYDEAADSVHLEWKPPLPQGPANLPRSYAGHRIEVLRNAGRIAVLPATAHQFDDDEPGSNPTYRVVGAGDVRGAGSMNRDVPSVVAVHTRQPTVPGTPTPPVASCASTLSVSQAVEGSAWRVTVSADASADGATGYRWTRDGQPVGDTATPILSELLQPGTYSWTMQTLGPTSCAAITVTQTLGAIPTVGQVLVQLDVVDGVDVAAFSLAVFFSLTRSPIPGATGVELTWSTAIESAPPERSGGAAIVFSDHILAVASFGRPGHGYGAHAITATAVVTGGPYAGTYSTEATATIRRSAQAPQLGDFRVSVLGDTAFVQAAVENGGVPTAAAVTVTVRLDDGRELSGPTNARGASGEVVGAFLVVAGDPALEGRLFSVVRIAGNATNSVGVGPTRTTDNPSVTGTLRVSHNGSLPNDFVAVVPGQ